MRRNQDCLFLDWSEREDDDQRYPSHPLDLPLSNKGLSRRSSDSTEDLPLPNQLLSPVLQSNRYFLQLFPEQTAGKKKTGYLGAKEGKMKFWRPMLDT